MAGTGMPGPAAVADVTRMAEVVVVGGVAGVQDGGWTIGRGLERTDAWVTVAVAAVLKGDTRATTTVVQVRGPS